MCIIVETPFIKTIGNKFRKTLVGFLSSPTSVAHVLVFFKLQFFVPRNLEEANVKFSLKLQNRFCCGVAIVQVSVLMKRRHSELLSVQSTTQRSISSVQVAEVAVS